MDIPTRVYIDYNTTIQLVDEMGEIDFIEFINDYKVITMDRDSYHLITSIIDNKNNLKIYTEL